MATSASAAAATARSNMSLGSGCRNPTRTAANPSAALNPIDNGTGSPAVQSMVPITSMLPLPKNSSLRGSCASGSSTIVTKASPAPAVIVIGPVPTMPISCGPPTSGTNEPSMRAENAPGSTSSGADPKNRMSEVDERCSTTTSPFQSGPFTYEIRSPSAPSG